MTGQSTMGMTRPGPPGHCLGTKSMWVSYNEMRDVITVVAYTLFVCGVRLIYSVYRGEVPICSRGNQCSLYSAASLGLFVCFWD